MFLFKNMRHLSSFISFFSSICIVFCACLSAEPAIESVINGSVAENDAWPWMLGLVEDGLGSPKYRFHCGATAIGQRYALTAAHCVYTRGKKKHSNRWRLMAGSNTLSNRNVQQIKISDITVHPQYDDDALALKHDLAIIRLDEPLALPIIPILPNRVKKGDVAMVLGWGQTSPNSSRLPSFLQQLEMPIAGDLECEQLNGNYFDRKTILCAGELSSEKHAYDGLDACYGDSGGPLMMQVAEQWYQIGIVSSGFDCASHAHFGMYTRLSNYYSWIADQTSDERELSYLLGDIFKAAKALNYRLSKKTLAANFQGTQFSTGIDKLQGLLREYTANGILTIFVDSREQRLASELKRVLALVPLRPNVARKRVKSIIRLSRALKRQHKFSS